jgi:hypothetical protein
MNLISKSTHCFNCDNGKMTRDGSDPMFYKYVCDTCGAYTQGLMSGYYGTQYYDKNGNRVFNDDGRRIKHA